MTSVLLQGAVGYVAFCDSSSFLAPLAVGQGAYVMARGPSCVHASVHAPVCPCVNFFFKHLLL